MTCLGSQVALRKSAQITVTGDRQNATVNRDRACLAGVIRAQRWQHIVGDGDACLVGQAGFVRFDLQ